MVASKGTAAACPLLHSTRGWATLHLSSCISRVHRVLQLGARGRFPPRHVCWAARGKPAPLCLPCFSSCSRAGGLLSQELSHTRANVICAARPVWGPRGAAPGPRLPQRRGSRAAAPGALLVLAAAVLGLCSQSLKQITKENGWCWVCGFVFFFLLVRC